MAASTTDTESAQALFCALADYVGGAESVNTLDEIEYPTYYEFSGYTGSGKKYDGKGYKNALKDANKIAKVDIEKKSKKKLSGKELKAFDKQFEKAFKSAVEKKKKSDKVWKQNNKNIKNS